MSSTNLIAYWIVPPDRNGPLGFGVTAASLDDAFAIIQHYGYQLPTDPSQLQITENVRYDDIDHEIVKRRMGAIVVRGLWYPQVTGDPPKMQITNR